VGSGWCQVILKRRRAPPQVALWTCGLVGRSPSDLLGYWVVRTAQVEPVMTRWVSGLLDYKVYRLVACIVLGCLSEVGENFLGVT
jgi:hypothetical protein